MTFVEKFKNQWRVAAAVAVPVAALTFPALQGNAVVAAVTVLITLAVAVGLVTTTRASEDEDSGNQSADYATAAAASFATVEFDVDGTIVSANNLFCSILGYRAEELIGQNHRVFVAQDSAASQNSVEYAALWDRLRNGQRVEGVYERARKNGQTALLKASYNPVTDQSGAVVRVIKYAEDVTEQHEERRKAAALQGAVEQSLARIEFKPDGTIVTANQNFLDATGYSLEQIVGQHHRIFMRPEDAASPEYQRFWRDLANGNSAVGEFVRQTSSGATLYLEASYNPVRDEAGKVISVVKLATDVTKERTAAALAAGKIDALNRSRGVLELAVDGSILAANDIVARDLNVANASLAGRSIHALLSDSGASERESRSIIERVARGEHVVTEWCFKGGDGNDVWFNGELNPITDDRGDVIQIVMYMDDVTVAREEKTRNQLLRASLERLTTIGIMVADADYNVKYLNPTIENLFRAHESSIRGDISSFQADKLLGANIDIFHKDPNHQRSMLDAMTSRHVTDLELGGLSLRLEVNPTFDDEGNRIGTVVEWLDRTSEVAVERAVQQVVDAAAAGDLSKRIDESIADGFLEWLPGKVNQLVGQSEQAVDETASVLDGLARGDLTRTMRGNYQGSYAELKDNVNSTVAKLTEVVSNIQGTTSLVQNGVGEISQGNINLSQRTEQQASSLEETASSMEQMTSTVKQNADNAEQANSLAVEAQEMAERGGAVVRDAVNAMAEISDSSGKISDIIGVIDEIAFQTNLLALNASVEAARAGEQGRGFAVVAREVRDLAGRSATAAKQIKELIEDSGQRVQQGSKLVNQSGETLDEIVVGIKRVTGVVGEITVASQEQAVGIEEVNRAVIQLDQLTQQNAALVEEAAAASESMGEQAGELDRMMRFFTVDGSAPAAASFSAPRPAPAASPAGPPGGVERRSASRPWSGGGNAASAAPAAAGSDSDFPMSSTGTGDEWEDF